MNRKPAVAGQFYPANEHELNQMLNGLFEQAGAKKTEHTVAILSPHAGYVYSGDVAASAFNQIDRQKAYKHIFVLASSHTMHFKGASIYSKGHYELPNGTVKVDLEMARKLIDEHEVFNFTKQAHLQEHSLEVQLPFLEHIMQKDYSIIPIIIGDSDAGTSREIAETLKPYFNRDNLFIISTDFSHYPKYKDANEIDSLTADAVLSNSPQKLVDQLNANAQKRVNNLQTSMCGWSSVLCLLFMTENENVQFHHIQYKNSGDAGYKDKSRVVGYHAISVSMDENQNKAGQEAEFELSRTDKIELLRLARTTIESYLKDGTVPKVDTEGYSDALMTETGAFVTLNKNSQLRGCIGNFMPREPLYKVVQDMAIAAATQDYRFNKVSPEELKVIDIEISVLTPLRKIESAEEFILGKHGIYIKKGMQTGTFLPQVADQTNWTKEEFLGHCSRDKAGLGWEGWKTAELYTYEALIFEEHEFTELHK